MSRNTKIILISAAAVCLLCGIICIISMVGTGLALKQAGIDMEFNREKIDANGHEILDYEIPNNYETAYSFSVKDTEFIFYTDTNTDMSIVLMQIPGSGNLTTEEVQAQFESQSNNEGTQLQDIKLIDTQEITISDQKITLYINEGTSRSQNVKMRQILGIFRSKENATGMLTIVGPVKSWNEESAQAFIDSLK